MLFQIALALTLAPLLPDRPSTAAAPAALPAPAATQELVFGNGTAGPFPLSWTAVRVGSERISVNGSRLRLGLDYLVEYETGVLRFFQPLRPDQVARVDYVYDASRAKPNQQPAQAPLSMRLWEGGSSSLQMIGAVQPGAAQGAAPTASLLGFRAQTALGGGQISSLFLLAPDSNGRSGGSAWQTSALQFGASRTQGPFRFNTSFSQAGAGFAPNREFPLQQGLRVLDLSAAFEPSRRVSFTSQVKRQEALDPAAKDREQTSMAHRLTLAPSAGTKLTFSQESTTRARPGAAGTGARGRSESTDALRAQIEQQLGARTTLTALAEQRRADATGRSTTTGVNLAARPTATTSVTAAFARTSGEKSGVESRSDLDLTVRPAAQLGFRIGFNQHLTEKQGSVVGADWGVTAGRNGLLTVEGQSVEKTTAKGPAEQTEQLKVAAAPLRGIKLTALMTSKQVGPEQARETRETSVELTPLRELRLAGTLREQELTGGTATVRGISGAVKPLRFLDLSGAYKTHEAPAGDTVVTRDVRLALTPVRGLKLQGAYAENPEDRDGQVLNATDRSLGLESTIGSLVLGGRYSIGESGANRETEQSEVRLALNLWGNSRFYSTYKASEERGDKLTQGRTLSLGFTRSLSDNLYLLLEGALTQVQVDGVEQPGLSDQRAQLRLGLRF